MLKDFKAFISRGNVIDLAVGVIIGSAFTAIVKSLTTNLINPLIGIFLGKIDLSGIVFKVGSAQFKLGEFLNSVINFLIIAFVVFLIVKFVNRVTNRDTSSKISTTDQLLTDIKGLIQDGQTTPDAPANSNAESATAEAADPSSASQSTKK
ncbi:large-conductance mechanosensitive channel protein MscL [Lactobacillus sp. Sy-1]|uniref:large-conductance mechanosensitive channel protein MscL n=1 Tax=Lactobacillus sp. Sy-1 TaxID=2109645 RepID=UPI001C55B94A|nr:large-conductance mechanosensitive channel protein MscL [Lactobacillus sp. Sy-1]MBW1605743.1 large-conductance mechanosensitive channel protein MscL [Lactobacillus sp. Sy-1]